MMNRDTRKSPASPGFFRWTNTLYKSTVLRSIHPTNGTQLAKVVEAMLRIGSPAIQVVYYKGEYMAIEGTHRIEAARILRVPVHLVEVEPAKLIDVAGLDIADNWSEPVTMMACEVASGLFAECNGIYRLLEGGHLELISAATWPPILPV